MVLIQPTDPAGRKRSELACEHEFTGKGEVIVPVALNDPKGKWRVRVRDVVTRQLMDLKVEAGL